MTEYSDNLTEADVEAVLRALPDHAITGDEIERLRGALRRIEAASQFWAEYPEGDAAIRYAHESTRRLARAALAQKGGE